MSLPHVKWKVLVTDKSFRTCNKKADRIKRSAFSHKPSCKPKLQAPKDAPQCPTANSLLLKTPLSLWTMAPDLPRAYGCPMAPMPIRSLLCLNFCPIARAMVPVRAMRRPIQSLPRPGSPVSGLISGDRVNLMV